MQLVTLSVLHCYRCVYSWTPVRSPVRICPRCKSKLWDTPKIRKVELGNGLGIAEVIGPHRKTLLHLASRYGARNLRVFGSVRRRAATADSDVDLLVSWPANLRGADPIGFGLAATKLLAREVHVVSEDRLHWSFRPQVLSEAVAV